MIEVPRRSLVGCGAILIVMFLALVFIFGMEITIIISSTILSSISLGVVYAYGKLSIQAFMSRQISPIDQMSIAVVLVWLGIFINRMYSIVWRLQNPNSPEYLHSYIILVGILLISLGGILHILAPGPDVIFHRLKNWMAFAITISISSAIIGFLIAIEIVTGLSTFFAN